MGNIIVMEEVGILIVSPFPYLNKRDSLKSAGKTLTCNMSFNIHGFYPQAFNEFHNVFATADFKELPPFYPFPTHTSRVTSKK